MKKMYNEITNAKINNSGTLPKLFMRNICMARLRDVVVLPRYFIQLFICSKPRYLLFHLISNDKSERKLTSFFY